MANLLRFIFIFPLLCSLPQIGKAQYNSSIRSDRPGQGNAPFSVGKNVFQMQSGFDVLGFNSPNQKNIGIAPNTVLKYGVGNLIDITTSWEYKSEQTTENLKNYSSNGLSLSSVGMRINFTEGNNKKPALGLQLGMNLPILSKAYNPNYIAPKILLLANQYLSSKFSLLLNAGVEYNGVNASPTGLYVVNFGYSINDQWSTFLETYGKIEDGKLYNKWNTGLAYLYNTNLQFDIFGGVGKNYGRFEFYSSIGISWRFKKNNPTNIK